MSFGLLPQNVFIELELILFRAKQGPLADRMAPGPGGLPDSSGIRTLTVLTLCSQMGPGPKDDSQLNSICVWVFPLHGCRTLQACPEGTSLVHCDRASSGDFERVRLQQTRHRKSVFFNYGTGTNCSSNSFCCMACLGDVGHRHIPEGPAPALTATMPRLLRTPGHCTGFFASVQ